MIFNALHILLTAAVTAVLALAVGLWRLPRAEWLDAVAAGALSGAAVALWRLSANMGPLNDDGLPGFSANDGGPDPGLRSWASSTAGSSTPTTGRACRSATRTTSRWSSSPHPPPDPSCAWDSAGALVHVQYL
jgi:hypothetical protein